MSKAGGFVRLAAVAILAAATVPLAFAKAQTPTPNGPPILAFRPVDADGCPFCCSFSCLMTPTPTPHLDPQGRPIFTRNESGFILVLEGGSAVGMEGSYQVNATSGARTFVPISHSSGLPSLQLMVENDLGNGSPEICDILPPTAGGIPGFDPPDFNLGIDPPNPPLRDEVTNALKDMACRFDVVTSSIPCTRNMFGDFSFIAPGAVRQFCYAVPSVASFKRGDTVVVAQFRGTNGNLGPKKEIVIRVGPPPSATATPTPTPTPVMLSVEGRIRYYSADRPVPNTTVQMSGPSIVGDFTDSLGEYDFPSPAAGSWTITPRKTGAILSGISSLDASFILQKAVNLRTFDAYQTAAADVSGNGTVSAFDAARVLQYKVGLLPRFDAAINCDSDWLFFPIPGPAPNQSTRNPQVSSGGCQMGRIELNPLVGAAVAQDFAGVAFGDVTGNWTPPGDASQRIRPGSVELRFGTPRQHHHRRRLAVPVFVEGPFLALDLEVGYDPNHFRAIRARRVGDGREGILHANTEAPGLIRLSMASAEPIPGGTEPVVRLEFEVLGGRSRLDLNTWSASIDDSPVNVVQD